MPVYVQEVDLLRVKVIHRIELFVFEIVVKAVVHTIVIVLVQG